MSASMDELFGPARSRLLRALRIGSDAGMHVRELSRGAGLSLSSLQRELRRLAALGAIERSRKGNRIFHTLRRRDPVVRMLLAAITAVELRGVYLAGMPRDRDAERALAVLCAHIPPDPQLWRRYGEADFLAGLAVALAGHSGYDRSAYLTLAESLRSGAATLERYRAWHDTYRPDLARLFSMVDRERRTYARAED